MGVNETAGDRFNAWDKDLGKILPDRAVAE